LISSNFLYFSLYLFSISIPSIKNVFLKW
jgi:hypothetical protein